MTFGNGHGDAREVALDRELTASVLAGAATGGRSLTGVAALVLAAGPDQAGRFLGRRWVKVAVGVLAAQEYVVDKLPFAPSRLAGPGLAGRLGLGAASGVIIARHDGTGTTTRTVACGAAAAGAAAATAWLGVRWRGWAGTRFGRDWMGAGLEDAAVLAVAALAASAVRASAA